LVWGESGGGGDGDGVGGGGGAGDVAVTTALRGRYLMTWPDDDGVAVVVVVSGGGGGGDGKGGDVPGDRVLTTSLPAPPRLAGTSSSPVGDVGVLDVAAGGA